MFEKYVEHLLKNIVIALEIDQEILQSQSHSSTLYDQEHDCVRRLQHSAEQTSQESTQHIDICQKV